MLDYKTVDFLFFSLQMHPYLVQQTVEKMQQVFICNSMERTSDFGIAASLSNKLIVQTCGKIALEISVQLPDLR